MKTETIKAYGTEAATADLKPMNVERREVQPHDVEIEIAFCGICHSDLHAAKNDWGATKYPLIPGHEIVGEVTKVGNLVTKFKSGDLAGIGCIVDSCGDCVYCKHGLEQFCEMGNTIVFGSPDKYLGGQTIGGYSERIVANEDYVLKMPENLDPAAASPLLCGGITVYSPLKHWKIGPGKTVGIVGIGGLGHLAIKIAKALGAKVTAFTTDDSKFEDAKNLGADDAVLSTDKQQMNKQIDCFDLILDTVSAKHDVNEYLSLLKVDGSLVLVGLPSKPLEVVSFGLIHGRKNFAGSNIGGIEETQEMLEFCAENKITAEIEKIDMQEINRAYERMESGDVKYRFVVDMSSL
ncbi:MAG: NAD(P)-dependent alcohol dehydrogenase [Pyrinomonadaceae bacterium]